MAQAQQTCAAGDGRCNLAFSEAPFGTDRQNDRSVSCQRVRPGSLSRRIGEAELNRTDFVFQEVVPSDGIVEFEQVAAAALFAGSDNRVPEFLELAGARIDDASLGDQRDDSRDPQFSPLFYQPFKALSLGDSGGKSDWDASFGSRGTSFENLQFGSAVRLRLRCGFNSNDSGSGLEPGAVEQNDFVSRLAAKNVR